MAILLNRMSAMPRALRLRNWPLPLSVREETPATHLLPDCLMTNGVDGVIHPMGTSRSSTCVAL